MMERLRAETEEAGKDPAKAEIDGWILHDLRRTAATGMARLNIAPHVVDRILNHVSGTIGVWQPSTTVMPISRNGRQRLRLGGGMWKASYG
jgi:hypothetical protein